MGPPRVSSRCEARQFMVDRSIALWPQGLTFEFPLSQVNDTSRDACVTEGLTREPRTSGTVVEALMWLRLGRFDPAHAIVQDASQGLPAYVHGMLHRLEGDSWNANYWFRQTRDASLHDHIVDFVHARNAWKPWEGEFDPSRLTQACELWHKDPGFCKGWSQEDLQYLAQIEWEAVWENALNSLS
jgi:hypothetical protein